MTVSIFEELFKSFWTTKKAPAIPILTIPIIVTLWRVIFAGTQSHGAYHY